MAAVKPLMVVLVLSVPGGLSVGFVGRDPCKASRDSFTLSCSNITSHFFSSDMFLSLDDDIARFSIEVRRLEVHQSNVTALRMGSFKRMPRLSQLIASNVSLREIERGAFEGLTKLKYVDLSYNDLESVAADTFRDGRIGYVSLEGNAGLQIPRNGPILSAESLRSLILRKCDLEHLSGSAFFGTPALLHLDLGGNRLEMLPRDVFSPLRQLTFLDLSDNRFRSLDAAVFASVPSYPARPHHVVLAGNRWTCDCRLSTLVLWATKNPGDGTWARDPSESRLRRRTECREPSTARGASWNDDHLRATMTACRPKEVD